MTVTVWSHGEAVRCGLQQFAALREALGDEVEIIIDGHTRLDLSDGVTLCRELEPLRPFFVEDPVRCENSGVLARLRQATGVPMAMGEQYATKWEFREPLENDWIDFARIDVCNVGGITEAMKVAHWCETHYVPIAPHNPLGPVSTAACVHMDLAVSNFGVQECAREPGQVLPLLFPDQVPFERGQILPSDDARSWCDHRSIRHQPLPSDPRGRLPPAAPQRQQFHQLVTCPAK